MADDSELGLVRVLSEKLPTRIRGLICLYPEGLGTMKGLLQNADGAGALEVRTVVDRNTHDSARLSIAFAARLQGPKLLAFNDREVTPRDLHSSVTFRHSKSAVMGDEICFHF